MSLPWTQKQCNFVNISESVGLSDFRIHVLGTIYFHQTLMSYHSLIKLLKAFCFYDWCCKTLQYTIHAARQYMVLLLYRYSMYNLGTMQKQGNLGWFWLMSDCHWHIPCNQNTTVVPAWYLSRFSACHAMVLCRVHSI